MWRRRSHIDRDTLVRTARLGRSPHVRAAAQADQTVLLDIERGQYYALNEVGSRVWTMICEGVPFAGIVDRICAEYDVTREHGERDAALLLRQLLDASLIRCDP
ncbi:MAG TPA: PqqD family protein [Gemmatimonadaceae bacterium]|nr:PqqD family protein [Gemmatimonadaceae bacterium]